MAEESLSNAALVQAYNRQEHEIARFHRENEGSFAAQMAATRLGALFSPLVNLIELAGVLVVIAVGTWELSQGRLTIGGLLVFLVYLSQLYTPIRGLSSLLNARSTRPRQAPKGSSSSSTRSPRWSEKTWARPCTERAAYVEFDAVSLPLSGARKRGARRRLLRVSARERCSRSSDRAAPGSPRSPSCSCASTTRTPGRYGSTATTCGTSALHSLRENVAVLLQETLVFDGTVRENIAYGKTGGHRGGDRRAPQRPPTPTNS